MRTVYELKLVQQGFKNVVWGLYSAARSIPEDVIFWIAGRDWDFPVGPVKGKKGEVKTIEIETSGVLFRAVKFMAIDTAEKVDSGNWEDRCNGAGFGTALGQVEIGPRLQRATCGTTLSYFFSVSAIGNGVQWDTVKPWHKIKITIHFLRDCTFYGQIWGAAIL